jgi:NAD(P) transhydrogenase subunit alpha
MIEITAPALIAALTILFLSIFLGFELISQVPPTLHTPLMSGANAISGIAIVGALVAANAELQGGRATSAGVLGFLALVLATINVVGGFLVTNRMLQMFKKKDR